MASIKNEQGERSGQAGGDDNWRSSSALPAGLVSAIGGSILRAGAPGARDAGAVRT